MKIDRRSFVKAGSSFVALGSVGGGCLSISEYFAPDYAKLQKENDLVLREDYLKYLNDGDARSFDALERLDKAFEKVLREVRETEVADPGRPAIWYLYNMGIVVKSADRTFAIDLVHPRAAELVPFLDFALITHNHGDHWTKPFYNAMNKAGKTVVSNFLDNFGVKDWIINGGFTRAEKTFTFGDVSVKTRQCDHNKYLVNFTTFYEIHIGDFTLCHTGDCSNHEKLKFSRKPDLWVVHPYCGMDTVKASVEAVHPKKVLVGHIEELAHPKNMWRWSYSDGLKVKSNLESAGFAAVFPLWGDRVM
jgi:L-ascorbate metabolism protein UlaG (beta-lactamase superfamily)